MSLFRITVLDTSSWILKSYFRCLNGFPRSLSLSLYLGLQLQLSLKEKVLVDLIAKKIWLEYMWHCVWECKPPKTIVLRAVNCHMNLNSVNLKTYCSWGITTNNPTDISVCGQGWTCPVYPFKETHFSCLDNYWEMSPSFDTPCLPGGCWLPLLLFLGAKGSMMTWSLEGDCSSCYNLSKWRVGPHYEIYEI